MNISKCSFCLGIWHLVFSSAINECLVIDPEYLNESCLAAFKVAPPLLSPPLSSKLCVLNIKLHPLPGRVPAPPRCNVCHIRPSLKAMTASHEGSLAPWSFRILELSPPFPRKVCHGSGTQHMLCSECTRSPIPRQLLGYDILTEIRMPSSCDESSLQALFLLILVLLAPLPRLRTMREIWRRQRTNRPTDHHHGAISWGDRLVSFALERRSLRNSHQLCYLLRFPKP